jgi:hypothetical protein
MLFLAAWQFNYNQASNHEHVKKVEVFVLNFNTRDYKHSKTLYAVF